MPRNRGEYNGQNSQNFKVRIPQSQDSVAPVGSWALVYGRCGKNHNGKCHDGSHIVSSEVKRVTS